MNGETKGILGIIFAFLIYSEPFTYIISIILSQVFRISLMSNPLSFIYVIPSYIFALVFFILSLYFSIQARKQGFNKIGTTGIVLASVFFVYRLALFIYITLIH